MTSSGAGRMVAEMHGELRMYVVYAFDIAAWIYIDEVRHALSSLTLSDLAL